MAHLQPDQRRSLQDYAAIAAQQGGPDPWACRSCGCRDWRVRDSRITGAGPRKRERICRNCGEPMPTQELPVPDGHKLIVVRDDDAA